MSIPRIELTSEHLDWDPASNRYEEQEESMTDYRGEIAHHVQTGTNLVISSLSSFSLPLADITHDDNFASLHESKVQVCTGASRHRSGKMTSTQGKAVDAL